MRLLHQIQVKIYLPRELTQEVPRTVKGTISQTTRLQKALIVQHYLHNGYHSSGTMRLTVCKSTGFSVDSPKC